PSFSEFKQMAKQGNLIPIHEEFLADTETPVSAYLKIKDKFFSYLLERADGGERWGRYSFIGYKPYIIVSARGREMEIQEGDQKKILENIHNPLDVLRDLSLKFKQVTSDDLSPFQGGLVGYFNFDLIRKWESLPGLSPDDKDTPECIFIATKRLIMFDHLKHRMTVVAFAHLQGGDDLEEIYSQARRDIEETKNELQGPLPVFSESDDISLSELEPNFKKEQFEDAVRKIKEYIVAGDVIQVVLSQRFSGEISGEDFLLYRNLRSVNPSPYMFYLNFGEVKLIGASPEILVRLTDGKIELRPIAGTRSRGENKEADLALEEDLMADPKERAEHIMLVDLGRNDVGKVATPGSVTVPQLMVVERYSHVMHIVSAVEGQLKPGLDGFDLFMSSFPAGTVSGAPKIRAMEIISELEPASRGPYAGAVGYFAFNGNMDFCITIRTIAVVNKRLSIQVGAGIVADSSPEEEYRETLRKGAAMFRAIERVKE
ncbi:MAG: anthranilate synthase component I, partial [Desulfobacterales bacterium]|nr:anthranilate synthase component I [Desulfobacterales bacterium]